MAQKGLTVEASTYRAMIYGDKRVGKTTAARKLAPKAVVLAVGPAPSEGADLTLPEWTPFKAACTQVVDMDPAKRPLLIIEDVELAFQACRAHVLGVHEWPVESMSGDKGLGYQLVKQAWLEWFHTLLRGGPFVLLAQSQLREVTTIHRYYSRTEPVVSPMAMERLLPHLNCILHAGYETDPDSGETRRVLRSGGREDRLATGPIGVHPLDDPQQAIAASLE